MVIDLIRAIVRPIVTVVFALAWIGTTIWLITGELGISVPYILFTVLAWGCIVWYYDDRTYFHRHSSPLDVILGKGK